MKKVIVAKDGCKVETKSSRCISAAGHTEGHWWIRKTTATVAR